MLFLEVGPWNSALAVEISRNFGHANSEHPQARHERVKPDRQKAERNRAGEMLLTVTFGDPDGNAKYTLQTRFGGAAMHDD